MDQSVIYEVNLDIDPTVQAQFDEWLGEHIREMLVLPGFESAQLFSQDPDPDDPQKAGAKRTVQYRVSSAEDLRNYFEEHAERMRAEGTRRFGEHLRTTRRVLNAPTEFGDATHRALAFCRNCNAPMTGQYCADCGQRDRSRMISVWELLRDLIGDLFELDSRIWRTVIPLMRRPGLLTADYLAGRRVKYTPPLRLYLVVSILFFLVLSLTTTIEDATVETDGPAIVIGPSDHTDEDMPSDSEDTEATEEDAQPTPEEECESHFVETGTPWFDKAGTAFVQTVCIKAWQVKDNPTVFLQALFDNVPKMMFFFLPLLALIMKFLYPLSKRYYVEHLLFFVHFHSFFFLALTITVVLSSISDLLPGVFGTTAKWAFGIAVAIVSVYTPIYLFRAMRRVYDQWWIVRFFKFLLLFIGYIVSLSITVATGTLYTLLTQ